MPAVSQVIRGSRSITSGDGTSVNVTISSVDTSRAIVMYTARESGTGARDKRHYFRAVLTGSTTLNLSRFEASDANTVVVEYTVVEFEDGALVSLQTGTINCTADPTDITISAIDTSASFPILSWSTQQFAAPPIAPQPNFQSSTSLRLDFTTAPASNDFNAAWQVVEFDPADASVQTGLIVASASYTGTATITAVDLGKTVLASFSRGANLSGARYNNRSYLSSTTQISTTVQPLGTAVDYAVRWFVIEMLDDSTVESGLAAITASSSAPSSAPSWATAMTNGAVFSPSPLSNSYITSASDADSSAARAAVSLDSPQDGVTITRSATSQALGVAWQVIDWAGSSAPSGDTDGSASGTSTASGIGASDADTAGSSAGTSTTSATGASTADSVGSADGASTVSGVGEGGTGSDGTADGTSTVSGVGASVAESTGSSDGTSAASGVGEGSTAGASDGSASGTSTANGVGASTAESVGHATGTSDASGVTQDLNPVRHGPLPWATRVNGRLIVGTRDEIERIIREMAEEQAEEDIEQGKATKPPRIKIALGRPVVKSPTTPAVKGAEPAPQWVYDAWERTYNATLRAAANRKIEEDDEEAILALML